MNFLAWRLLYNYISNATIIFIGVTIILLQPQVIFLLKCSVFMFDVTTVRFPMSFVPMVSIVVSPYLRGETVVTRENS